MKPESKSNPTPHIDMLIAGTWIRSASRIEVRNPLDRSLVATVSAGTQEHVREAIRAAAAALESNFPAHERYEVLMRAAARVEQRREAYALAIAREGSKSIREAQQEPSRAANILRLCAEEGRRICGETLPFDSRPGSENRIGYWFRFPAGIVGAITPFNDPLAVAAHKVGPALAAGNAVVLKPASATPISALYLARDLMEAGLPPGRLSVIPGHGGEIGKAIVTDPRVRVVSFTGGVAAGTWISSQAGIKKLLLELGSNSPVIVLADADLEKAIPAIAAGAFAQAGQNCLGVQRVFVHSDIYHTFADWFTSYVSNLRPGSSLDEKTDVCAMINEREAIRVEEWIREAAAAGAYVLVGGTRDGALLWPTVLEEVPEGARLDCQEAYGPVVLLYRVDSLDEAIEKANRVEYGLHAAIFTESIRDAFAAVRRLHAAAGYAVQREYYVNDVGTQVDNLGKAMYARYAQALGQPEPDPEEYQGEYLVEMGQEAAQKFGDTYLHVDRAEALNFMRRYALDGILASLKEDTALIGIHFDNWFFEQSLYDTGTYALAFERLKAKNMLVEREGAIWLKSEDTDDKENVIVRSDGRPTYFASDIAYVWDKLSNRNFEWAIYIWGADHHGHVKRVKNATRALGLDPEKITLILYQLVTITREGVPVRQSKRAGNFITVREVVEEIGSDAFRFMLLTRSADSPMELDLALATKQSNENPVFYVQYGHARIASIFRKAQDEGASMAGGEVTLLIHPAELELIRQMLRLREIVAHAAETLSPHSLTYYAQDLATAFHAFYRDCRVVSEDAALTAARLKLVKAAQITLANTLRLMGMSAPERM